MMTCSDMKSNRDMGGILRQFIVPQNCVATTVQVEMNNRIPSPDVVWTKIEDRSIQHFVGGKKARTSQYANSHSS